MKVQKKQRNLWKKLENNKNKWERKGWENQNKLSLLRWKVLWSINNLKNRWKRKDIRLSSKGICKEDNRKRCKSKNKKREKRNFWISSRNIKERNLFSRLSNSIISTIYLGRGKKNKKCTFKPSILLENQSPNKILLNIKKIIKN